MDERMDKELKKIVGGMNIAPNVEKVSVDLTLASSNIIRLIDIVKATDSELAKAMLEATIAGLSLTLSDSVDDAYEVLNKAKEKVAITEKEINQREENG